MVEEIAYPNFELNVPEQRRKCPHGVIVKMIGMQRNLVRAYSEVVQQPTSADLICIWSEVVFLPRWELFLDTR